MYAVEFEAPIKDGVVHIPKDYHNLYENREVRVFIMPINNINNRGQVLGINVFLKTLCYNFLKI